LDKDLILASTSDDQKPTVGKSGDRGKGRSRQASPVCFDAPRLETKTTGAAQHLGDADFICSNVMPNLSGIGCNAIHPKQQYKSQES
jgi:hypothetical protein